MDSSQKARFTCTSLIDSPDSGALASAVGELTYRFYSPQTNPAGAGTTETYMGFIYWGRRADVVAGAIYDQNGNVAQPASTYKFPRKAGDRPTSRTLLTCPCYVSNAYGLQMPHCGRNDAFERKGPNVSTPGNGLSDPTATMQGINIAYTDGSARWVPRRQLWSMFEGSTINGSSVSGGYDWLYFDHTN